MLFFQLSDLAILEEVIRMVLEIINSCVTNTLHHNPNLVYTLLHRRELFAQFRTHPLFHDIIQNIDTVSGWHYGLTLFVLIKCQCAGHRTSGLRLSPACCVTLLCAPPPKAGLYESW